MHMHLSIALELGDIAHRGCMPQALSDECLGLAVRCRAGTNLAELQVAVADLSERLSQRHITARRRFSKVLETIAAAAKEAAVA